MDEKVTSVDQAVKSIAEASRVAASTAETILAVQKQFNDNFLLHSQESQLRWQTMCENIAEQNKAIGEMRKEFKDWFYPLIGDILKKVVYVSLTIAGAAVGLKISGLW
jgi:hypothetical protein